MVLIVEFNSLLISSMGFLVIFLNFVSSFIMLSSLVKYSSVSMRTNSAVLSALRIVMPCRSLRLFAASRRLRSIMELRVDPLIVSASARSFA